MADVNWRMNPHKKENFFPLSNKLNPEKMENVLQFHQTFPNYSPTPLFSLDHLAKYLGLQDILCKDESFRFGLNSFKGLGSSYAMANQLAKEYGQELSSFSSLKENIEKHPAVTFATATDGNHGRGVAWAAKQLNQHSVVFMPKGSSQYRLNKIRELGAQADITAFNYDETVRYVSNLTKEKNWILLQDTAWKNYEDIPTLIMQGYLTILGEYVEQIAKMRKEPPTHVILQAANEPTPA